MVDKGRNVNRSVFHNMFPQFVSTRFRLDVAWSNMFEQPQLFSVLKDTGAFSVPSRRVIPARWDEKSDRIIEGCEVPTRPVWGAMPPRGGDGTSLEPVRDQKTAVVM